MDPNELLLTAARAVAVYVLMLVVIRALASVFIQGPKRRVEVRLRLVLERGVWRVDRLPDFDEF